MPKQHNQRTQVLFAAGYNDLHGNFVVKLIPEDDSWKDLSEPLPYEMTDSKMAVVGGRIWLVSGRDSEDKFRKQVFNMSAITPLT